MIDNRYPHLCRIEEAPSLGPCALTDSERKRAANIARRVGGRTDTRCAYNVMNGMLFFYWGSVEHSAGAFPFKEPYLSHTCLKEADVDDVVYTINCGRRPWREKERDMAAHEQQRQRAATEADQRHFDDVRPEAEDYAVYLDQKRRGVWQKSLAVH